MAKRKREERGPETGNKERHKKIKRQETDKAEALEVKEGPGPAIASPSNIASAQKQDPAKLARKAAKRERQNEERARRKLERAQAGNVQTQNEVTSINEGGEDTEARPAANGAPKKNKKKRRKVAEARESLEGVHEEDSHTQDAMIVVKDGGEDAKLRSMENGEPKKKKKKRNVEKARKSLEGAQQDLSQTHDGSGVVKDGGEDVSMKQAKQATSKEKKKKNKKHGERRSAPTALEVSQPLNQNEIAEGGKGRKSQEVLQTDKQNGAKERRVDTNLKSVGRQIPKKVQPSAWKVSDPIGGVMLDLDPVFSQDEEYLLVAYETAVVVYSTSTSLPIRRLQPGKSEIVTGFAVSSSTSGHLYISSTSGKIELWDWAEGKKFEQWRISSAIHSLLTSSATTVDERNDLVYTVDRNAEGPWLLSAHRLVGEVTLNTSVKTLLKNQDPLSSIKVLDNGRLIVATSGSKLMIGTSETPAPPLLGELSYVWRIVDCPEWIVSIDTRLTTSENGQKKPGTRDQIQGSVDVAVGGLKGSIYIYEDLLRKLVRSESASKKNDIDHITSRRLHWHRNAVLAMKWSLDGNYIISGGQETTLVLWQLETSQKQMLPHLGAPIESIVVSPSGSSYGIRLADNSAMILSTSELRPTFSIAGIQVPAEKSSNAQLPFVPTVHTAYKGSSLLQRSRFPACVSSMSPGRLLFAVLPSNTSRMPSMIPLNASYLQSFDIEAAHQISRQALTRTKITTLNMGPESNIIEEPNVTHIQTSTDGRWLATVDEWMPPEGDLAPLAFDQQRATEEQISRQEIYLKFWSWNENEKIWELVSRIDNPQNSESGNPYNQGKVLDLVSDPSSQGFATVGEDGLVKIWKPAKRRRHGLEVRGKHGKTLMSWFCYRTVPLESSEATTKENLLGGKLAYSPDGSVLAAGLQSSDSSPISLIDALDGEIRSVQTRLYTGPLLDLAILSKYLVTLSNELCVWDLVNDELHYGVSLDPHNLSLSKQIAMTHLAVDAQHSLFAIAIPKVAKSGKTTTVLRSQFAVFDPAEASPLFTTALPHTITSLLPATGKKGFYAIDSAAEVRTLVPSQSMPSDRMALPSKSLPPSRGLTDIFGNGQNIKAEEGKASKHAGLLTSKLDNVINGPRVDERDVVVVSQDRLAEVFDVGSAFALPPVTELFEQVASLYGGRTES